MKGQGEVTFSVLGLGAGGAEWGGDTFSLCSRDVIFVFSHVAGGGFGELGHNLGSVREGGVRGDHGIFSRPDRSSGKDISKLGSPGLGYTQWPGSTHFVPVYVVGSRCLGKESLWSLNRYGDLEALAGDWLYLDRPPGNVSETSLCCQVSISEHIVYVMDKVLCSLPSVSWRGDDRLGKKAKGPLPDRAWAYILPLPDTGVGQSFEAALVVDRPRGWSSYIGVCLRLDPSEAWLQPAREPSRVLKEACVVVWGGLGLNPIPSTPGLAQGDDCYGWVHTAFGGPGQALFLFLLFLFP